MNFENFPLLIALLAIMTASFLLGTEAEVSEFTALMENSGVEVRVTEWACSNVSLVKLESPFLRCSNNFELYCMNEKVTCLKDITEPVLLQDENANFSSWQNIK